MQDTVIATAVGNMFICSEVEAKHDLSEIEVRTFVSIKRVIWDQLLAFRALIIEKNAFLMFTCFEPTR